MKVKNVTGSKMGKNHKIREQVKKYSVSLIGNKVASIKVYAKKI